MPIVCKNPNVAAKAQEEMKTKHPETKKAIEKKLQGNKRSRLDATNNIVKNFYENLKTSKVGRFVGLFTGKSAAMHDLLNALLSPTKIRARKLAQNRAVAHAYEPIKGNEAARQTMDEYKLIRVSLLEAKKVRDAEKDGMLPEDAYNIPAFLDVNEKRKAAGKSPITLDQFIEAYESKKNIIEDSIAASPELKEVQARLNKLAKTAIDEMNRLDPELTNKLIGEFKYHTDALDNIMMKLKSNDIGEARAFYKRWFGVDVSINVGDFKNMEIVTHHMLDHYTRTMELHKYLLRDQPTEKLKAILEGKKEEILQQNQMANSKYIEGLEDGHPLKEAYKDIIHSISMDVSEEDVYIKAIEDLARKGNGHINDFDALFKILQAKNTSLVKESLGFLTDVFLINKIKNNKETYPNLNKLYSNKFDYDPSALLKEISTLKETTGDDSIINKDLVNKIHMDNILIENFKKELIKERNNNAEKTMEMLRKEFGDYTFATKIGTKLFNVTGKVEDIKNIKEVFGHIVDLSDPSLIAKDIIDAKLIQDGGYKVLVDKLIDGDIVLISKEQAETISYLKSEIKKTPKQNAFRTAGKIFSTMTLFNPISYPGYALTTQIFGNIGHTMMADPSAFKHWPKMIKQIKHAWRGDYHNIENKDIREIVRKMMTSENASLYSVNAEDWKSQGFDEVVEALEQKDLDKMSGKQAQAFINKLLEKATKHGVAIASIIEMVSRGSMAYEILMKKRAGKQFIPPTANKHRVDYLLDYDEHLAAVRLANDTHIDYGAMPPAVRRISMFFPFMSFKVGSTMNMTRSFVNVYREVGKAMKTGDWGLARSHVIRSAIGVAWRAGVAATIWNMALVSAGIYSPEKRKQNNSILSGSIFGKLFGFAGLNLDNHIYLPGTGIKFVDSMLRIGKANQKYDVMQTAEGLIPGLGKEWRESVKKDGFLMGGFKTVAGKVAAGESPLIKTPAEVLLGGGTIYESGYRDNDPRVSGNESLAIKAASFIGMGTVARATVNEIEGIDSEYKSDSAYAIKDWKSQIDGLDRTEASGEVYSAGKMLQNAMSHMNTKMTLEYMRIYEHALEKQNADLKAQGKRPRSPKEIQDLTRQAILRNTLEYKAQHHTHWLKSLTKPQFDQLQQSIASEKIFLRHLGFGRW